MEKGNEHEIVDGSVKGDLQWIQKWLEVEEREHSMKFSYEKNKGWEQ